VSSPTEQHPAQSLKSLPGRTSSLLSSFIIASQTIASTPDGSDVTAAPSAQCCPPPAVCVGRCRMSSSATNGSSRCIRTAQSV
jgi:hypothetical protein